MSKQNKVNKDAYTQAGRLTPDEAARERHKQARQPRPPARRRTGTQPSSKRVRKTRVTTAP
jgi:hypothetical protein